MSLWLDGLLPEEESARLMDHLAACPACQRCLAELTAIRAAMAPAPIAAPEGFARSVMDQVAQTRQERPRTIRFPRWRRWAALAACCALAAAGLWGLQGQKGDSSAQDAAPAAYNGVGALPAESGGGLGSAARGPEDLDGGGETDDARSADTAPEAGQAEEDCPAGEVPSAAPPVENAAGEDGSDGWDLVDYETARSLFGPGLPACTEEDFWGYVPEVTDAGTDACAVVTYVFSWGTVTVEDLTRLEASKYPTGGGTSVERSGAAFSLEDAGGGETLVHYAPSGEEGLAYTAQFDSHTEPETVLDLLLSLNGG